MNSSEPILSVCIPAYKYSEGVQRILDKLENRYDIEILISEDKSDAPLQIEFKDKDCVRHIVNMEPTGAVNNWNMVIGKAKGRYIWLLHHDDEPIFFPSLSNLLEELSEDNLPDCIYVSKLLSDKRYLFRLNRLKPILLRYSSNIFFLNYLGAPSNIIFPRKALINFDNNLQWYVDCDWYFRLFNQNEFRSKFNLFGIKTHLYDESITNSLDKEINSISKKEIQYIINKYNFSYLKSVALKFFLYLKFVNKII